MILRLARHLDVPPRERNALLHAAGFAAVVPERPLTDPALSSARRAVELVLRAHQPFPALAIDRHWTLVMANAAAQALLTDVDAALLTPPLNVLRVSLHPRGLAPRIVNLAAWREHVLHRVARQVDLTGDAALRALLAELHGYAADAPATRTDPVLSGEVAVPLELRSDQGVLSFLSTTTVFGTPLDITLSELAIEAFLPADEATARALGVQEA